MPNVDPVILQLRADIANYNSNVASAQRLSDRRFNAIEGRAAKMTAGIEKSFNLAGKAALSYVATLATVDTVKMVAGLIDSSKSIEAQLRLATKESGSFAQAQADVRRVAAETRTELASTAQLYGNFQRNARELGISQDEAARATETVAKAFKVSGAATVETAQGTRQLVQALQSGVLRGDEFNTIMEAAPRLAKLFADSLGVTQGQLRKMAEEGQLTSNKLTRALTDKQFTAALDAEFRQMPVTFSEAMTQIENAATIVFGAFDRGGEFSNAITSFTADGTTGFQNMETAAEDFGRTVRAELDGIAAAFGPVMERARELQNFFSGSGEFDFSFAQDFKDIDRLTGWAAKRWADRQGVAPGSSRFAPAGTDMYGDYLRGKTQTEGRQRQKQFHNPDNWFGGKSAWYESDQPRTPLPAVKAASTPTASPTNRKGPSAETLAKRAEADRQRAIRDEASKQREEAQLQDDLLAAKAALKAASEDILAFEMQMIDNEKAQRIQQLQTDSKLGDLSDQELAERTKTVEQIAEARKQRALIAKSDADFAMQSAAARDQIDTERADADLVRGRLARAEAEKRILELTQQEESNQLERQIADGQILDAKQARANLERRQLAEQEMLRRNNMTPGERYLDGLQEEAENLGDAYESIAVDSLEKMNRGFADAAKSALGLHGILGDIIGDLIEIAFRQAVIGPLADALFGGGGSGLLGGIFGGGSLGSSAPKTISGKKASGGPVAAGGTYLIGERGPELLKMGGSSGLVVPNNQLQRGGGTVHQSITIKVDAQGALLAGQVQAMVAQGVQQATVMGSQLGAREAEGRIMSRGRRRIPG